MTLVGKEASQLMYFSDVKMMLFFRPQHFVIILYIKRCEIQKYRKYENVLYLCFFIFPEPLSYQYFLFLGVKVIQNVAQYPPTV